MHEYAFFMHGASARTSQRANRPAHEQASVRTGRRTNKPAHKQDGRSQIRCSRLVTLIKYIILFLNRLIIRIFVQNRVSGQMLRIKGSHKRIYAPKKRTEYHILEYPGAKIVNTFKLLPPKLTHEGNSDGHFIHPNSLSRSPFFPSRFLLLSGANSSGRAILPSSRWYSSVCVIFP